MTTIQGQKPAPARDFHSMKDISDWILKDYQQMTTGYPNKDALGDYEYTKYYLEDALHRYFNGTPTVHIKQEAP